MKRLKAILFIVVALCSFFIVGSLVKATPSTVSVTVRSYFDEENVITSNVSGKAFGTKFSFDGNLTPDGRDFAFWIVNGVVRNDIASMQHSFYATKDLELTAIFTPVDQYAVVFMDSNGKLLKVEYVSPNGNATDIVSGLPTKPGYQISSSAKWSGSLTNIQANTVLTLQYEKDSVATYTVTVTNGTGTGTYNYNEVVTVVADAAPVDQHFSHWTIDGVVASKSATYQFTVLRNTTIEAHYAAEAPADGAMVFLNKGLELQNGYTSYQGNFYLPEGFELIELGILYDEHEESFDFDTTTVSKKIIGKYLPSTNEFLVSLNSTNHHNARAYMMYTNTANTEVYFAYSNYIIPVFKDLFISEYGEGPSNNKWIEIYNPTDQAIDLADYTVVLYNNGATTASSTQTFDSTMLAANEVYVLYHSSASAAIQSLGDASSSTCNFNGDDAIALLKNGVAIDVFGVIGTDPGSSWTVGDGDTVDNTLVRKYGVYWPTNTWDANEWDVFAIDTINHIGFHNTEEILPSLITISGPIEVVETKTIQLSAAVLPSNAVNTVTWVSLNESIATVDNNGVVTGVSEGLVTIKAISTVDSNVYDEYEITVTAQVFYTVQFNLNGGNSDPISSQSIAEGGLITEPSDPAHATKRFIGWFTEASGGTEWVFASDTVSNDMTLYAQWVDPFTIQFDLNGGNSSAIPNQYLIVGEKVIKPTNPTHATDSFAGWFTQASEGNQWAFDSDTVSNHMTLYAQWSTGIVTQTATIDSSGSYSSGVSDGVIPSARLSIANLGPAGIIVEFYKNSSSTITIFNNGAGEIRLYGGSGNGGQLNIGVSSGYKITKVTINTSTNNGYTINGGATTITDKNKVEEFSTDITLVIIKNVASSTNQVRITDISIEYEEIPG